MLPNFLIIGTPKAGTTWLAKKLAQHPDIFLYPKEIHYFSRAENFKQGQAWYENHFTAVTNEKAVGEKSVHYLNSPDDDPEKHARAMHQLLPDARLIVVFRNPVERAISHFNHMGQHKGNRQAFQSIDPSLTEAIDNQNNSIRDGFYYRDLKILHQFYDPAQILILIYEEEIVQNKAATLAKVCRFLEVDSGFSFQDLEEKINVVRHSQLVLLISQLPYGKVLAPRIEWIFKLQGAKPRPSDRVLERLYAVYADENQKFYEMLGRSIPSWEKEEAVITE